MSLKTSSSPCSHRHHYCTMEILWRRAVTDEPFCRWRYALFRDTTRPRLTTSEPHSWWWPPVALCHWNHFSSVDRWRRVMNKCISLSTLSAHESTPRRWWTTGHQSSDYLVTRPCCLLTSTQFLNDERPVVHAMNQSLIRGLGGYLWLSLPGWPSTRC